MLDPKQQYEVLARNTDSILPEGGLLDKLYKSKKEGKPLNIKLGFDPTAPDLHIGHAVVLKKLREFQELGHNVIVLLGDFTARIGDPTGKSETRKPLTDEQIQANVETYLAQLGKILDLSKTTVRYNSEWLATMSPVEVIKLTAQTTVAQMLERDNFEKRFENNEPIALHEFLYPLFQGYDSIAINADVELGGTDQRFNNLMGRQLQLNAGLEAQVVLLLPILTGTDGTKKMSKSLNNYIGLYDAPNDIYGKVMSIPDSLIVEYLNLATNFDFEMIDELKKALANGENPRNIKMKVAFNITEQYAGTQNAQAAQDYFINLFSKKQLPDDIVNVDVANYGFKTLLKEATLTKQIEEYNKAIQAAAINNIEQYQKAFMPLIQEQARIREHLNDVAAKMAMEADKQNDVADKIVMEFAKQNKIAMKIAEQINIKTVDAFAQIQREQIEQTFGNNYIKSLNSILQEQQIEENLEQQVDLQELALSNTLLKLLADINLIASIGEGKRLIEGGGIKVNEEKITDVNYKLSKEKLPAVVQVGKRKFVKFV